MKEARVRCLTKRYEIPELGLVLRQGDERFLTEAQAKRSSQLDVAVRAGAVSVEYIERFQTAKSAKAVRAHAPPSKSTTSTPVVPEVPPTLTREDVRQVVREELRVALQGLPFATASDIRSIVQELVGGTPSKGSGPGPGPGRRKAKP